MHIPLLFVAIGLGNAATVQLLLDRGARLDIRWDDKDPLEAAVTASNCDGDTIDLLLERGAAVELRGHTILHRAAMGRATVRGVHVLFHLLEHERVRALVNTCVEGVTALGMAVYAGNVSGVHALLQAGAVVESGEVLERLVGIAVEAGRRPRTASPTWTERAPDGEELYQWRVGMEEIVLASGEGGRVGGGGGMRMFVGDRERLTPGAFLEDIEGLEEAGEEEEYLEELRQLREYVQRRMIEEGIADSTTPEGLERWLGDHPVSPNDDKENRNAIADLEGSLQKLKLEREETELSGGDGTESVAERQAKLRKAVELQRQRLGDTDLATLRAMTNLYECLANQGKFDEASALHQTVLEQRQAQLPPDHIELWGSLVDKTYMTWGLGRVQEANDYALALSLNAVDTFGAHHPVTIKVETARAGIESSLGNHAEAVRIQEAVLELDKRASCSQPISDPNPDLDFHEPLFYLRASLTLDYCRAHNLPAATELSNSLSYRLDIAKPKEFFHIFDTLLGVAAGLDLHAQHEASEPILTAVVETCLKTHRNRKSYATQTALERLASHYGQRGLWEKQAKTLATLVDQLKSTVGPEHADTIQQKRGLATALGKCGGWVEAGLLQEQVLKALEEEQQQASSPNSTPSPSQSLELEIAAIKTSLCETLRHQNQLTSSESHGWDAVHFYRAALGADHARTLSAEYQLGLTLSFASKPTEAITLLERRVASTVRTHGESHMQTSVAAQALCGALLRATRHAEAETQAVRCLEIARAVPEANDEMVGIALYIVAMCKARGGMRTRRARCMRRR
ncbi:serine/threonine protein kinase [Penicillium canariense]|uniref:Serine/threonine protein kinase n=1 Tax=Penicillium canariense TaxID=189055 RepID=A0A9W9HNE2_9EURO|nr:serine/threonine protein kinase [Penicillium canariense]KAJ5150824.1 serine/threonine protein kinase [Penicillium canariense]